MRKLKLDVSGLKVTSFTACPPAEHRGTVNAHIPPFTLWDATCEYTCGYTRCGDYTCQPTCSVD